MSNTVDFTNKNVIICKVKVIFYLCTQSFALMPILLIGQNISAKFILGSNYQGTEIPLSIGDDIIIQSNSSNAYSFEILDNEAALIVEVIQNVQGNTNDPLDQYENMFLYVDQSWPGIPGTEQYTIFPLRVRCIQKNLPKPPIYVPIDPCHVHPCADAGTIPIESIPQGHEVLLLRRAFFWENSEQLNCDLPSISEYIDLFLSIVDPLDAIDIISQATGIIVEIMHGNSPREVVENILIDLYGYTLDEVTGLPVESLLTILYDNTNTLNGDGGWIDPHGPYADIKLNICPSLVGNYSDQDLINNNDLWGRGTRRVIVTSTCSNLDDVYDCNPFDNFTTSVGMNRNYFEFYSDKPCEELSFRECLAAFRATSSCLTYFSVNELLEVIDTSCWIKECPSVTNYRVNKLYGPIWGADVCGPNPHNEWVDGPWGCVYSNTVLWDWDNGTWPDDIVTIVGSEADKQGSFLFINYGNPSDYIGKGKISRNQEGPILIKIGICGWIIVENVSIDSIFPKEPSVEITNHYWYPYPIWNGHYPAEVIGPEVIDMNGNGNWYSECVIQPDNNWDDNCISNLGFDGDTREIGSQYLPYNKIEEVESEVSEFDSVVVYGGIIPPGVVLHKQLTYFPLDSKLKYEEMESNIGNTIGEHVDQANIDSRQVVFSEGSLVPEVINLLVSPNPVNDFMQISFYLETTEEVNLWLTDSRGIKVSNILSHVEFQKGKQAVEFGIENINKGLYFLCLSTSKSRSTCKVIIVP